MSTSPLPVPYRSTDAEQFVIFGGWRPGNPAITIEKVDTLFWGAPAAKLEWNVWSLTELKEAPGGSGLQAKLALNLGNDADCNYVYKEILWKDGSAVLNLTCKYGNNLPEIVQIQLAL
jgi:hypothetical protein